MSEIKKTPTQKEWIKKRHMRPALKKKDRVQFTIHLFSLGLYKRNQMKMSEDAHQNLIELRMPPQTRSNVYHTIRPRLAY